jgi:hypothetical protein
VLQLSCFVPLTPPRLSLDVLSFVGNVRVSCAFSCLAG